MERAMFSFGRHGWRLALFFYVLFIFTLNERCVVVAISPIPLSKYKRADVQARGQSEEGGAFTIGSSVPRRLSTGRRPKLERSVSNPTESALFCVGRYPAVNLTAPYVTKLSSARGLSLGLGRLGISTTLLQPSIRNSFPNLLKAIASHSLETLPHAASTPDILGAARREESDRVSSFGSRLSAYFTGVQVSGAASKFLSRQGYKKTEARGLVSMLYPQMYDYKGGDLSREGVSASLLSKPLNVGAHAGRSKQGTLTSDNAQLKQSTSHSLYLSDIAASMFSSGFFPPQLPSQASGNHTSTEHDGQPTARLRSYMEPVDMSHSGPLRYSARAQRYADSGSVPLSEPPLPETQLTDSTDSDSLDSCNPPPCDTFTELRHLLVRYTPRPAAQPLGVGDVDDLPSSESPPPTPHFSDGPHPNELPSPCFLRSSVQLCDYTSDFPGPGSPSSTDTRLAGSENRDFRHTIDFLQEVQQEAGSDDDGDSVTAECPPGCGSSEKQSKVDVHLIRSDCREEESSDQAGRNSNNESNMLTSVTKGRRQDDRQAVDIDSNADQKSRAHAKEYAEQESSEFSLAKEGLRLLQSFPDDAEYRSAIQHALLDLHMQGSPPGIRTPTKRAWDMYTDMPVAAPTVDSVIAEALLKLFPAGRKIEAQAARIMEHGNNYTGPMEGSFAVLDALGMGSTGIVLRVIHENGQEYAVKLFYCTLGIEGLEGVQPGDTGESSSGWDYESAETRAFVDRKLAATFLEEMRRHTAITARGMSAKLLRERYHIAVAYDGYHLTGKRCVMSRDKAEVVFFFNYMLLLPRVGPTLKSLADYKFSPMVQEALLREVVRLVAGLHSLGYCHLDVKADNVAFDSQNNLWLLDLGSMLETVQCVIPDRLYLKHLSPEFVAILSGDPTTLFSLEQQDTWATAMMLYELFCHGRLPFGLSYFMREEPDVGRLADFFSSGHFEYITPHGCPTADVHVLGVLSMMLEPDVRNRSSVTNLHKSHRFFS